MKVKLYGMCYFSGLDLDGNVGISSILEPRFSTLLRIENNKDVSNPLHVLEMCRKAELN